jgi:hypothetical protein
MGEMLKRPDSIADVDDLALVRMTRGEVLDRYGVSAMHWREKVICEQVLTAEVLKGMFRRLLEMPEGVRNGLLVWELLLPLVPLQPHGLDVWDVRWAARDVFFPGDGAAPSAGWWWRLRVVHDIPDPVAWIAEMAERREPGWRQRVAEMCWGEAEKTAKIGRVSQLAQQCRKDVERRKRRLNRDDGGES